MAKRNTPSTEELLARIKNLEEQLERERTLNRRILDLPEDAPEEEVLVPWSTEWMQKQADENEIIQGLVTKVYAQRIIKLLHLKSGDIIIKQHYGKSARGPAGSYAPLKHTLTIETFFLILESMEFAEKAFGLNRKAVIDRITNGEGVTINRSINNF